jgi:hypothetical protein
MDKNWKWTDHILEQIKERELTKDLIEMVVNTPDEIVLGKYNRQIYHKLLEDKLVRVVADGNVLITVYITNKIKKYMKGKQV